MSTNQQERLAVETFEERERLQQISTNQQERLAVETPERENTQFCVTMIILVHVNYPATT